MEHKQHGIFGLLADFRSQNVVIAVITPCYYNQAIREIEVLCMPLSSAEYDFGKWNVNNTFFLFVLVVTKYSLITTTSQQLYIRIQSFLRDFMAMDLQNMSCFILLTVNSA